MATHPISDTNIDYMHGLTGYRAPSDNLGYRQPASQGPLFNLGNIGPPKVGGGLLQPRRRVVGQLPSVSGRQGVGDQAQGLSPLMLLFMQWQRQLQEAERFGEPSGRLSDQDIRGASRDVQRFGRVSPGQFNDR